MIDAIREAFNKNFTEEKYQYFLKDIEETYHYKPRFRIAETPVFVNKDLKAQLVEACEDILKVIENPDFKSMTEGAFLDPTHKIPNENDVPKFLQFDFGICQDENGNLSPKLIELQGFPSLYGFQIFLNRMYRKHFGEAIPRLYSQHIHAMSVDDYTEMLRREIVGDTDPKQVVLLEIDPHYQTTAVDFYVTRDLLGIEIVCVKDIIKKGRSLFYKNENGDEVKIEKIFNRVIFDELYQRKDLKMSFSFQDDLDIEWIGHPNWFFRISKYLLPLLKGKYVPKSFYLDQLDQLPDDLENYVLKPMFSFAGAGVHINVTPEIIKSIENKSNYILQEKVSYAPIVKTKDINAKFELRMICIHNSKTNKIEMANNLVRLSKGEMVGVKYNKDKTWVGGSIAYFEV
jgi:hypothetical protein